MINSYFLYTYFPILLEGAKLSFYITFCSFFISIFLAVIIFYIRIQKIFLLHIFVVFLTTIIRGTPMIVQLGFFYYVLPIFGILLKPIYCAIFSIGICSAAYFSEVLRGAFASVPIGQLETVKVLGLPTYAKWRYIIIPHTFRTVFPALGNELILLSKDSSLASTIGVIELFKKANEIARITYDYVSILLIVALIYVIWTSILALIWKFIEKKILFYN